MINFIIIASFIFNWTESPTCVCQPISVTENFDQSTIIFKGEIITIDTVKQFDKDLPKGTFRELHLASIKVTKIYKGNASQSIIKVISGASYGDCGFDFVLGAYSIVYAKERDYSVIDSTVLPMLDVNVSVRRFLYTDNCDRTTSQIVKEDALLSKLLRLRNIQRKN